MANKKTKKKVVKKAVKKVAAKKAKKPSKKLITKNAKSSKKIAEKAVTAKKTGAVKTKKAIDKKVVKKVSAKKVSLVEKFEAHKTSLKPGDKAPVFSGIDQNGKQVNLGDFTKKKKVILYFYPKDDTPACTATACSLRDEYRYLGDKNYAVVGVSADSQKSHAKFAAKYELPFPLLADTELAIIKAYDVWGTKQLFGKIYDGIVRTTFIIGEDGKIVQVIHAVDTENHAQQVLSF